MDVQEVPAAPRGGKSVGAIMRQSKHGRFGGNKLAMPSNNAGADDSNKMLH